MLRAVRSLARERGRSLGAVASELIRRALAPAPSLTYSADVPVFQVREGAPPITPEMVDAALEDH